MAYAYKNLLILQNTGSGIAEQALIAPASWFAAGGIKSPAGDGVRITTNHQFASVNYGFAAYQLAADKNSYDAKTVGERGSQKLQHELKIFIPGSYEQAHEAIKNLLNEELIALHKDVNCGAGIWYQFGCVDDYAFLKADFSTGTTKDGVKGYNAVVQFVSDSVLLYAGAIKKLPS